MGITFLTAISSALLALSLVNTVSGLYEREKGLNDWHIESLGDIKDLKFLENSPLVYTLSTTSLLTVFDTQS
jgi:hypothetical protein